MGDRHVSNYVECDIPEGTTLREWRRAHARPRRRRFAFWRR